MKIAIENKSDCFITEKFDEREKKNAKCFSGGCLKLRLRFTEKGKIVWASCCETWQKFERKFAIVRRKKNEVRGLYLLGSYPLVGRHVVNELKIGCYDVSKLGIF